MCWRTLEHSEGSTFCQQPRWAAALWSRSQYRGGNKCLMRMTDVLTDTRMKSSQAQRLSTYCVLWKQIWAESIKTLNYQANTHKGQRDWTHLDEPDRYKGHIVCTEHRANQNLLHPPVKVHLQVLHFLANEVWREAAGVIRNSLNAIQLTGVLLPRLLQHSQIIPAPAHAAHLFGANAGDGGERTCSAEVTAQPEEWDIHSKSVSNKCFD